MEVINTDNLSRCVETLEKSYEMIQTSQVGSIEYEMFRNSLVKSFEITLEQSAKLLRKLLLNFVVSKRVVDGFNFKDLFREAAKHRLMSEDEVKRWFAYRDNRNDTAHDYGEHFAEETLTLVEDFVKDVRSLKKVIDEG